MHLSWEENDYFKDENKAGGFIVVEFRGPGSRGMSNPIGFRIGHTNHHDPGWLRLRRGMGMSPNFKGVPIGKSVWEISVRGFNHVAKLNGKTVSEVAVKRKNDHTGFVLNGGWGVAVDLKRLRITGRLNPYWLQNALSKLKE